MLENKGKLLLLGFGDIGQRLAQIQKPRSFVVAVRRSEISMEGIDCRAGDVTSQECLRHLLQEATPDQIVITLSPSVYSEQGYRETYLATATSLINTTRQLGMAPEVFFISSSSVYAQDSGELIDEKSECLPTRYNGRVLLETEQCLLGSPLPVTIIRFSGIYGPGRYRLLKSSLPAISSAPEVVHWTNRIHATDCARAIAHILSIPANERAKVYLASDSTPVPAHVVKRWVASRLTGATHAASIDEPQQEYTRMTGKRCRNNLLLNSGFQFKYPGYKEGFPGIIAQYLRDL